MLRLRRWLTVLVLCACGIAADAAQAQQAATIPPLAAGLARVWFLRQYEPSESLRTPVMYVNGASFAVSLPGTIFYRDFPPGSYAFTVASCSTDVNQSTNLNLAAGMQVDLEVQSLKSFHSWGCLVEETFYVRQVDPGRAQIYIPQMAYLGAR